MPYPEPPSIIPRAYTIKEMEGMRLAIWYIVRGPNYGDWDQSDYDDPDPLVVEERLRTHMLCNQEPQLLINEGERIKTLFDEDYERAENEIDARLAALRALHENKPKFEQIPLPVYQRIDDPEVEEPTKDEVPVGLITALIFAGIAFTFLIIFT